jgi:hypothetical protein
MPHATDTSPIDLSTKSDMSLLRLISQRAASPQQREFAEELLRERLLDLKFGPYGDGRAV